MVIFSTPINHIGDVYIVLHPPSKQNILSHCFINCGRIGSWIHQFFIAAFTQYVLRTVPRMNVCPFDGSCFIKRVRIYIEQVFIASCQIRLVFSQGGLMRHKARLNSHGTSFHCRLPNKVRVCKSETRAS